MDNLTPQQRSYCMSRIKGKNTGLERLVRSELHGRGLRYRVHAKELPGKPDIIFTKAKIAIFIDGDFWHGHDFALWQDKVSEFWKKKISKTLDRDQENSKKLREMGWKVIRLWQHEVKRDFNACIKRIVAAVKSN